MTFRILVWGIGYTFLKRRALLEYEIKKGNIECVAFCSQEKEVNCIDGIPVLQKNDVVKLEYDYILVFADSYYEKIKTELVAHLGIKGTRILDSRILEIYGFDFRRYINILEDPITIVCKDCLGAGIYHNLLLQFSSPFVLTAIDNDEYLRMLQNFEYYFNSDLKCDSDSDVNTGTYATAFLGRAEDDNVKMKLYHYMNFIEAKAAWDRRKKRVNKDRMLFIATISNQEEKDIFKECKLPGRKVGFVTNPIFADGEIFFYLPRYRYRAMYECDKYGQTLSNFLRDNQFLSYGVDVLKMLSGEDNFIREF